MKKVVFINEGHYGELSASRGDYDELIKNFSDILENTEESGKKVVITTVVRSNDEALKRVKAGEADSLVFVSRSMIPDARKIKREYPRINVVVLTGLIPDDEVRIVDKSWIGLNLKQLLRTVILY